MSDSTYILCPGQGAQSVGICKEIHDASAAAKSVFEEANERLGFDLRSICFAGPQARLDQTDVSQPALYVAGVASFWAAEESGALEAEAITAYAGLSLGEYTALHLAGAFDFATGLDLVAQRGKFMQEAALAVPSGMVAVIGGDEEAINKICNEARGDGVLVAANFNAPGQIVVSGDKAACERAAKACEAAGLRFAVLQVAGAFHSPLMQPAADRMREVLAKANIKAPALPVYSNVTAQPHGDVESIKRLLVEQIVSPVRWAQTMSLLVGAGEGRFIELAPGRTLAGLAKRINRRLVVEDNAGMKLKVNA